MLFWVDVWCVPLGPSRLVEHYYEYYGLLMCDWHRYDGRYDDWLNS